MRRALFDTEFIRTEDGKPLAVAFGSDFCAEHEMGVKGLEHIFGIKKEIAGIEGHRNTEVPGTLVLVDDGPWRYLVCDGAFARERVVKWLGFSESSRDDVETAWSSGSFAFRVRDDYLDFPHAIYEAILAKDVAIYPSAQTSPFGGGGPVIAIISRVPKDNKQEFYDADLAIRKLRAAAEKTGIKKLLKKAGKCYFALSPRWANDEETELQFWLNPCEQHLDNYGWFDIQALKQWAENKGPIPKEG